MTMEKHTLQKQLSILEEQLSHLCTALDIEKPRAELMSIREGFPSTFQLSASVLGRLKGAVVSNKVGFMSEFVSSSISDSLDKIEQEKGSWESADHKLMMSKYGPRKSLLPYPDDAAGNMVKSFITQIKKIKRLLK